MQTKDAHPQDPDIGDHLPFPFIATYPRLDRTPDFFDSFAAAPPLVPVAEIHLDDLDDEKGDGEKGDGMDVARDGAEDQPNGGARDDHKGDGVSKGQAGEAGEADEHNGDRITTDEAGEVNETNEQQHDVVMAGGNRRKTAKRVKLARRAKAENKKQQGKYYRVKEIVDEDHIEFCVSWAGRDPHTNKKWADSWVPKEDVTAAAIAEWRENHPEVTYVED